MRVHYKWFKGSKSKDGKGGWVNVVTGGTCASDEPGEGTPKCVSSAKRASMSKSERLSAARRKKKADPGQQSKTGAAKPTYVSTDSPRKKKMKEETQLNEVKDKKGKGSGSKDACYHKVKSRYSVWPSAYASGALVKCRKVGAANWGNKSEEVEVVTEDPDTLSKKAYERAQTLGTRRRSSYEYRKKGSFGPGKNERAGYNLSQSQASRNRSPETQGGNQTGGGAKSFGFAKNKSNPVKSKSVYDSGAVGHRKKRDEKVTTKKDGKTPLKTPRYKMSSKQRIDHHSSRRQELRDPKKNPKHTANK